MGNQSSTTNYTDNHIANYHQYPEFVPTKPGVFVLEKPHKVYKVVNCPKPNTGDDKCIATLVVPTGSKIVVPEINTCVEWFNDGSQYPECSKYTISIGDKMRTDNAIVVNVDCHKRNNCDDICTSWIINNSEVRYKKGNIVKPEFEFNTSIQSECKSGIHFFGTRENAEKY